MARVHSSLLITGGCGFVGLNLIGYLVEQGFSTLRIMDNLSVGTREDLEGFLRERGRVSMLEEGDRRVEIQWNPGTAPERECRITLLVEDIRDRKAVEKTLLPREAIIHLAAQTGVVESVEDPWFDCQVNVIGTLNLLQAAAEKRCPAFVFASSAAPMGDQPPPAREDMPPKPLSPYGATKLAGEAYCSAFSGSFGLPTCSLRFSNVYGPYSTFKSSVIAKFFRQALLGETLVVYGDGNQTRDFIHTHDLSQAIYLALRLLLEQGPEGPSGEVFQVATGRETSVNQLFAMIRELVERDTGWTVKMEHAPPRPGEIYRNYADISKIQRVLGFNPQVDIQEGLKQTWEWFKTRFR